MTVSDLIWTLRDFTPQRFDVFLIAGLSNDELPDSFTVEKTKELGYGDNWYIRVSSINSPVAAFRCRAKEDVGKESPVIGTMARSDEP